MATTPGVELIELETGVYARLHDGLTNAGFIVGDRGVLVIDSLRAPSFARDLVHDIRHVTSKPVQYVVDTHSHFDHAWGNEEFSEATIIGHENCFEEMADVEWNEQWREKVVSGNDPWSEEARLLTITPPNLTFETRMRLYFGVGSSISGTLARLTRAGIHSSICLMTRSYSWATSPRMAESPISVTAIQVSGRRRTIEWWSFR